MSVKLRGRLPSIPEYYSDLIDSSVDLTETPKQCCPFHDEDTPSFSYSADKGIWRCFGGCHCGGDVIDLHKKNYHMQSREEAKKSLYRLYNLTEKIELPTETRVMSIDETRVFDNAVYLRALQRANTVERWLELDYVMSQIPVESYALNELLVKWSESAATDGKEVI